LTLHEGFPYRNPFSPLHVRRGRLNPFYVSTFKQELIIRSPFPPPLSRPKNHLFHSPFFSPIKFSATALVFPFPLLFFSPSSTDGQHRDPTPFYQGMLHTLPFFLPPKTATQCSPVLPLFRATCLILLGPLSLRSFFWVGTFWRLSPIRHR